MTHSRRTTIGDDPFGLLGLDVADLRRKRGAKWQYRPAPYSAWVADMDFPVAPAVRDALQSIIDADEFGYPSWGGPGSHSPAVPAFMARMEERFGWTTAPDRLHEMNDVIQGIRVAVEHLSRPGDGVVLHMPAYHPFLDTIDEMNRRLVPVPYPFDDAAYAQLEAELRSVPAKLWILCHPQNPTGHVFQRPELERIAEIAARHELIVVSDEIHADLSFSSIPHVPFESLGAEVAARTVTVTSASKAFNLAGLRWAVVHAGCDDLQAALAALPAHYLGAPNIMAVAATVAAWTEGQSWLDEVVSLLDDNRHALSELLDEHLPGARYTPPAATYLAWIDVAELDVGDDPARTFRERGVAVSPGVQFGPQGIGHVRVNFATSPSVLAATVRAMAG